MPLNKLTRYRSGITILTEDLANSWYSGLYGQPNDESAGYRFAGVIDQNAGTTALVGTVEKTVLAEDTAAWDADVVADDANDALKI